MTDTRPAASTECRRRVEQPAAQSACSTPCVAGIDAPQDLSVISCDLDHVARLPSVDLTTCDWHHETGVSRDETGSRSIGRQRPKQFDPASRHARRLGHHRRQGNGSNSVAAPFPRSWRAAALVAATRSRCATRAVLWRPQSIPRWADDHEPGGLHSIGQSGGCHEISRREGRCDLLATADGSWDYRHWREAAELGRLNAGKGRFHD